MARWRATGSSRASATGCSRSSHGRVVGRAGLYFPAGWPASRSAGRGPRALGKGYAPRPARASCEWAHKELGSDHIISVIDPRTLARSAWRRRSARRSRALRPARLPFDAVARPLTPMTQRATRGTEHARWTRLTICCAARRSGRARGRGIGGRRPSTRTRRAIRRRGGAPLIEGGEGVEEGFEIAESDLREAATHAENRYDPAAHDFGDEESAGEGDAVSASPTRST